MTSTQARIDEKFRLLLNSPEAKVRSDEQRVLSLKQLNKLSKFYGIPCQFVFIILDYLYFHSLWKEFFLVRLIGVLASLIFDRYVQSSRDLSKVQLGCTAYIFCYTASIDYILFRIQSPASPYVTGLIFVLFVLASGYRFTPLFFALNLALTLIPPIILLPLTFHPKFDGYFWLNVVYLLGTSFISSINRGFNENAAERELQTRLILEYEIANRDKIIEERSASLVKIAVADAVLKQNQQIAYDIRSPLTALGVLAHASKNLPEQERAMVRAVTNRIQDIAHKLSVQPTVELPAATSKSSNVGSYVLATLLEPLVSEKRLQYRARFNLNIELEFIDSYNLCSAVDSVEFSRVISNLIDNSADSISKDGSINICLSRTSSGFNSIRVKDNGSGIPASLIPELGKRGATFGKTNGKGLGLFHAKNNIEEWNGSINFSSVEGVGTDIRVELPPSKAPAWFLERLELQKGQRIAILDDDQSIHLIWEQRFASNFSLEHFAEASSLSARLETAKFDLFLVDLELRGSDCTGLELVIREGIVNSTILVTSRFDDPQVKEKCLELGIQIIPKSLAAFAPIEVGERADSK